MENVKTIVDELRKRGLTNGSSLGYHSGLMDEAADLIEELQAKLTNATKTLDEVEQMLNNDISYYREQMQSNRTFYAAKHATASATLKRISNLREKYVKE